MDDFPVGSPGDPRRSDTTPTGDPPRAARTRIRVRRPAGAAVGYGAHGWGTAGALVRAPSPNPASVSVDAATAHPAQTTPPGRPRSLPASSRPRTSVPVAPDGTDPGPRRHRRPGPRPLTTTLPPRTPSAPRPVPGTAHGPRRGTCCAPAGRATAAARPGTVPRGKLRASGRCCDTVVVGAVPRRPDDDGPLPVTTADPGR
ncbi:hypothetical protein GCM10009714_39470 [Microlunatus capsulatus]